MNANLAEAFGSFSIDRSVTYGQKSGLHAQRFAIDKETISRRSMTNFAKSEVTRAAAVTQHYVTGVNFFPAPQHKTQRGGHIFSDVLLIDTLHDAAGNSDYAVSGNFCGK